LAPFFINYGARVKEWGTRFGEPEFPIGPWPLDHIVIGSSDPVASASWLAGALGLSASQVGHDAVDVALPGCTIAFADGPANRPTEVVLTGPHAPFGEVTGPRYWRSAP
jgi:hypothetical protein